MSERMELTVGTTIWDLSIPDEKRVGLHRRLEPTALVDSPRDLVRAALENPHGLDAPMYRALTPDDRVVIVLDERLPHICDLLVGVIEHLSQAKIEPSAITVVVPHGGTSIWIDDLPDEFADIHVEVHDPEEQPKLAYLATTKAGRRIYLNRTLVEADFVIVLTGRPFDPTFGHGGAEVAIFPGLADAETMAGFVGRFSIEPPDATDEHLRAEAREICWLFGNPFLIQVIEGPGDTVQEVVAGLPDCTELGAERQDAYWRVSVDDRPDLVVAAVAGSPERITFQSLASAAATAARVVVPGGRIAILAEAAPVLLEGAEILRQTEEPSRVAKVLYKRKPDDWPAAALWAFAAESGHLFLASGFEDDVAEELYTTPLKSSAEVQRLIDMAERVLILPDAQKLIVDIA